MVKKQNGTPQVIMNARDIHDSIQKMSYAILEKKINLAEIAIVGIKTRGEFLAQRFRKEIEKMSNNKVDFGTLDITLYRDDFDTLGNLTIGETDLLFNVNGKRIILVDDVLQTGRTIRAAIDELIDFGRPSQIELAVLIDRGGRELPICANYIGQTLSGGNNEYYCVKLKEIDEIDEVIKIVK